MVSRISPINSSKVKRPGSLFKTWMQVPDQIFAAINTIVGMNHPARPKNRCTDADVRYVGYHVDFRGKGRLHEDVQT